MKIQQILSKYGHIVKDWDVDKDESQGDCYFVYLKKPYVYNDCGQITDMIYGELKSVAQKIKSVYQDEVAYNNL